MKSLFERMRLEGHNCDTAEEYFKELEVNSKMLYDGDGSLNVEPYKIVMKHFIWLSAFLCGLYSSKYISFELKAKYIDELDDMILK